MSKSPKDMAKIYNRTIIVKGLANGEPGTLQKINDTTRATCFSASQVAFLRPAVW